MTLLERQDIQSPSLLVHSPGTCQGPGSLWSSPDRCPCLHDHSGSWALHLMPHLDTRTQASVPDPREPHTATPLRSDRFLPPYPLSCLQQYPASGIRWSPVCSPPSEALLPGQNTHPNLSCLLTKGRKSRCLQVASDSCPTTSSETRRYNGLAIGLGLREGKSSKSKTQINVSKRVSCHVGCQGAEASVRLL